MKNENKNENKPNSTTKINSHSKFIARHIVFDLYRNQSVRLKKATNRIVVSMRASVSDVVYVIFVCKLMIAVDSCCDGLVNFAYFSRAQPANDGDDASLLFVSPPLKNVWDSVCART